jgi:hypothetical protein
MVAAPVENRLANDSQHKDLAESMIVIVGEGAIPVVMVCPETRPPPARSWPVGGGFLELLAWVAEIRRWDLVSLKIKGRGVQVGWTWVVQQGDFVVLGTGLELN